MPKFEPHLIEKKPRQTGDFRDVNANAKERRNGLSWERKSKMRQMGLRAFELKWDKFLKTIHGFQLRLGDGVKKHERNGYQMRERK